MRRQVREGERVVDVRGGEVGGRVAVVRIALVVGARGGRQRQQEEQGGEGRSCAAHDLPVVGASAAGLHAPRTHDGPRGRMMERPASTPEPRVSGPGGTGRRRAIPYSARRSYA